MPGTTPPLREPGPFLDRRDQIGRSHPDRPPHEPRDDSFARDIERAWLIRGEEENFSRARGVAALIFAGVVLVSVVGGLVGQALGIDAPDMLFIIIAVLGLRAFGCYCTGPRK